jgi:hypothetical protein
LHIENSPIDQSNYDLMPSGQRASVAFVAAALTPTLMYSLLLSSDVILLPFSSPLPIDFKFHSYLCDIIISTLNFMFLGIIIGGVIPGLTVGIILYFLLRKKFRPSLFICMIIGGLVANTQTLLFEIFSSRNEGFEFTVGKTEIFKDGFRTFDGWISFAQGCLLTFLLGALGGIVFWWIVKRKADGRSRQLAAPPAHTPFS